MKQINFILDNERFCGGFTTRFGGVSSGAYEGLNLGDHVGDEPKKVAKNREILAKRLGVMARNLKFMRQIHSSRVEIIRNLDDEIAPCDGIITNLKGVALCVLVADCSPILIVDEVKGVIAAIHAGRAGVVGQICTNAVNKMKSEFSSRTQDLKVFVGPNIKGGCYDIGELDLGEFSRYKNNGKFDINAALADEFARVGVQNVKFDEACTHCDDRYFSYRRDGATGRFAGFMMMR
ncbi:peptidoglycan editing factor PgeF [Campylobacter sp. RM16187]|uniref:peptidoglycan editing factor PgeF n=1 Tax=Campylobacter sp. RM16187 TaxID=1660063 RepID=UPI0021B67BA1|nr:peptidoglycan editing factor PgeF [Campylobacter sp. RM16187]QKG29930.1 multi-copper polyphenol oxidoreductase laccase [Campylobacter sp. RM16187]